MVEEPAESEAANETLALDESAPVEPAVLAIEESAVAKVLGAVHKATDAEAADASLDADEEQTAPDETAHAAVKIVPIEEVAEAEAPDATVESGIVEESVPAAKSSALVTEGIAPAIDESYTRSGGRHCDNDNRSQ